MENEGKVNILIVDDRKENIHAIEAVLTNTDYRLISAQSGEQALKYVLLEDFAVILLDVQMPGLNGFETAKLIKQRPSSRDIPIIFITALSKTVEHMTRGYAEGAIDYMFKPFHPEILRSKVEAFVQLYKKQKEIERQRDELQLQSDKLQLQSNNLSSIIAEKTSELKKANQDLHKSQELFQKLFQFSPNLKAIRSKKDGRYLAVNKSWVKFTGYTYDEIQSECNLPLITRVNGQMNDTKEQPLDLQENIYNEKVTFETKGGSIREGLLSTESVYVQDEPCIVSVITDITDQTRLEKEITRLDRLNLVGEMAAGIAHEVRNPMTTVLGFLQLAKTNENPASQSEYIDLMIDELNRANKIITEFLALAKNKATNLEEENLNQIIQALFPLLQADAFLESKQIILKLGECPKVKVDEKEIRQLILNIALNGLESMKAGGELLIQTYVEKENVVIEVTDQGCGIKKEILDQIGTPFFTTKDNGTGLGLAICYSIASRHQAKIDIESTTTGTSFYIHFPISN